jgi:hypothetical protein
VKNSAKGRLILRLAPDSESMPLELRQGVEKPHLLLECFSYPARDNHPIVARYPNMHHRVLGVQCKEARKVTSAVRRPSASTLRWDVPPRSSVSPFAAGRRP